LPKAFVIEAPAPEEEAAPRKPRAITGITFEPEVDEGELIVMPPAPLARPRRFRWGALLMSALFLLVSMWAGLAVTRLVEDFFARSPLLGWAALGVAAIAGLAALVIIAREIWALARLRRIEHIQVDAAHAINADDAASAKRATDQLKSLYAGRPDAQLGLKELKQYETDILDGRDRMKLVERHLVSWRDAEAHRIIAHAARRITLLTTVAPTPALDILFVAAQNLRMIRELATLYGGRPSTLSTIRLALSDNLIQHVVGKGLLGRLSARFGEGTVNGILTARVGLAARDVCRPIPQEPSAKETLGSLLKELVSTAPQEKAE
jgi:putative membrane protein